MFLNISPKEESCQEDQTAKIYHGRGCRLCQNSGYKGRLGVFEVMPMNDELQKAVAQHADITELTETARRLGMRTLRESGIAKILAGLTTIEEIKRVTK